MQMNLFRPPFKREQFDVVLCYGVLHHANDPHGGWSCRGLRQRAGSNPPRSCCSRNRSPSREGLSQRSVATTRGLYNRWGCSMTDLRRLLIRLSDGRGRWLDDIFMPQSRGTRFDHFLAQTAQVFSGSREGGFFLMIGRRPVAAKPEPGPPSGA